MTIEKKTFFKGGSDSAGFHPLYSQVRDDLRFVEAKLAIENLWDTFQTYCDSHFLADARKHFPARLWEMYLGASFLRNGCKLLPTKSSDYPDLCVQLNKGRLWIEAVLPDLGAGPDRLRNSGERLDQRGLTEARVPEREISLRFTSALQNKLRQIMKWKSEGKIEPNDYIIIAVCGYEIQKEYWYYSLAFYFLKVLYGIGSLVYHWTENPDESGALSYNSRDHITKNSGSEVGTCVFREEIYSAISGIIYTDSVTKPFPYLFGEEMLLFHNPQASNRIPFNELNFLGEMMLDVTSGERIWNERGDNIKNTWDFPV